MKTPVSLYDALMSVQVPSDKARAVAEALESDMSVHLATRQDLLLLRKDVDLLRKDMDTGFALVREEMKAGLALVKAELKQDLTQQTVRRGVLTAGGLSVPVAALKLAT